MKDLVNTSAMSLLPVVRCERGRDCEKPTSWLSPNHPTQRLEHVLDGSEIGNVWRSSEGHGHGPFLAHFYLSLLLWDRCCFFDGGGIASPAAFSAVFRSIILRYGFDGVAG